MAVIFPTSPIDGQTFTSNNVSYIYSASRGYWLSSSNVSNAITQLTKLNFTATSGQNTYSVAYDPNASTQVIMNGIVLSGTDYTADNGTTIVFAQALGAGDQIEVYFYPPAIVNTVIATTVDDLTDAVVTNPTTGQVLTWSGLQWQNSDATTGGVTVYSTVVDLPLTGNNSGDQAFVESTDRLYIFTGTGWYEIALINTAPQITGGGDGAYVLATDGTPTVITLTANDPEGLPITWSYSVTSGSLGSIATVSQANNVFTITPSTQEADAGEFSLTFTASDGVNIATDVNSFTLTFGIDWSTISEQVKIYPAIQQATDAFGDSIDIDGDIAVIGATGEDGEGNSYLSAGAAYVYTRSGSTWTERAIIRSSDIEAGEKFAHKVCIDGNTIAVSAPFKTVSGTVYVGSVYIYTTADNGATWTEQQKLTASNGAESDFFGWGLGLSGDLLVVGSHQQDTYGAGAGSAYVFKRTGSTWTQQQQLVGDDTAAGDQFGFSFAISNDTIVVGARTEDNGANTVSDCGAVYVFTTSDNGSTWTQQDKFVSSTPTAVERFGSAVDIHGDIIVVGASSSNSNQGAGWIFTRSGSTWTQRVKLTPVVDSGALFGNEVSIDKVNGNVVAIGAQREHISGLADVGAVFIYSSDDNGLTWTENAKITSSDGLGSDNFGYSVSINDNTVIVGAKNHDFSGLSNAGAAYIFTAG